MEIRSWRTTDVYYDEQDSADVKKAERKRKQLEKAGYMFQQTDGHKTKSGKLIAVDQYISHCKITGNLINT